MFVEALADPSKRQAAAIALAGFGTASIPHLARLLLSPDAKVATIARSLIQRIEEEERLIRGGSTADTEEQRNQALPHELAGFINQRIGQDLAKEFAHHFSLVADLDNTEAIIDLIAGHWDDGLPPKVDTLIVLTGFSLLLLSKNNSTYTRVRGPDVGLTFTQPPDGIRIMSKSSNIPMIIQRVDVNSANRFMPLINLMVAGNYWGNPAALFAKIKELASTLPPR